MSEPNEHVFDDLPLLLSGDADRATVTAVSAHLQTCADCRDALIAALAAHAALRSAARFAPELAIVEPFAAPGSTGGSDSGATADVFPIGRADEPDLSAMFAQVRAEAAREQPRHHAREPVRRQQRWLVAAAAAIILALGGTGTYLAVEHSSSASGRSLSLAAFDQGTTAASARLVGSDRMIVDASALPALGGGRYYEVWLTNGARTSMAPVGVLDADRKASISVPASEMSTYAAVEVSVQETAGVGAYSGHSVLRGSYA
jgi:hypothetical protein